MNATGLFRPAQPAFDKVQLPAADACHLARAVEKLLAQAKLLLPALLHRNVHVNAKHPLRAAIAQTRKHATARCDPYPVPLFVAHAQLGFVIIGLATEMRVNPSVKQRPVIGMNPVPEGVDRDRSELR